MHNLKERIRSGEVVHGCWINMGSPVSAEIIGNAGFDWVLIDLEHGAGNDVVMYNQLQVLAGTPTTSIVRIDEINRPNVQHIMDAGATGVMFPQIQSREDATHAISMLYYPPKGIRGMAKMVRATGFGKNSDSYINSLDKNVIGVIQIETINSIEQLDAIAAIEGVDVLFVGPSDLTLALGIFGQLDHHLYQRAIKDVADAAKRHNKTAGVLLLDSKEYDMYFQLGYRFLACGADGSFVAKGAEEMVKQLAAYRAKG